MNQVCHVVQLHDEVWKQVMFVVAIVVGLVVGVGCFTPLIFGMNLARKATPTSNFGHAGSLLLGVLLSLVILAVATVACVMLARDLAVPFVVAEAVGLIAAAVAFGVTKQLGK